MQFFTKTKKQLDPQVNKTLSSCQKLEHGIAGFSVIRNPKLKNFQIKIYIKFAYTIAILLPGSKQESYSYIPRMMRTVLDQGNNDKGELLKFWAVTFTKFSNY